MIYKRRETTSDIHVPYLLVDGTDATCIEKDMRLTNTFKFTHYEIPDRYEPYLDITWEEFKFMEML